MKKQLVSFDEKSLLTTMQYLSEVISGSALLIAVLALLENRRNNRIGNAPAIIGYEYEGPTDYSYVIRNKGNGPAYFEKVEFFPDQKPLRETMLREAVTQLLKENGIRSTLSVTHPAHRTSCSPAKKLFL